MSEPTPVSLSLQWRPLLEAVSFAARAHRNQLRKDGKTPYVSHVFRVCLIARTVFGFDEPSILKAALLHDVIEDTTTDFDSVEESFGTDVAERVATLSKDMRQRDDQRDLDYQEQLRNASWEVKVCKLADIFDNTLDSAALSPSSRRWTFARSKTYLTCLKDGLPEKAMAAFQMVEQLLAEVESQPGF